ncbi:low affinity iron permease family protein [Legionella jordanis]|uniref:Low affinity iron permease n=1 Tax=Legionella jordanis TaxID=456 RepID=A0A0W0V8R6_9GAMM|nr:low affinity iron permease family protein [Legionella jordanis]KTD16539.1 Low affinity iron permease [Legionella jordanis]RMX04020.1 low affinity iron permease family protein [Legionella jordanis]RMX22013.1 low affinity iron permease family protein [Legionella jordanis]VEH11999.1 Predicted small integral membrane protein [Legionella jordanis]HAT8712697.1 low affinity iron permease family protein [Legionella jordanis]
MKRARHKKRKFADYFTDFAHVVSEGVGKVWAFILALLIVLVWLITGPFFHYSDTWQLWINTGTTIITFLMVFLIQHTQNRDTFILNLKLDELIKSHSGADNSSIDLSKLTDDELKMLEEEYRKICNQRTGI